jgi:hypothetical protein
MKVEPAIRVLLLGSLLCASAWAGEPAAPAAPPAATAQSDDAWMAALQSAMREARAGDREAAIRSLARMRDAAGDDRDRRGIAGVYLGQMLTWSRRGQQAHTVLGQATVDLAAARERCDGFVIKAHEFLLPAALEMRDFQSALASAGHLRTCVRPGVDAAQAAVCGALTRVHLLSGDLAAARASFAAAERELGERRDPLCEARLDEVRGLLAARSGDHVLARRLLARATDDLRRAARPSEFAGAIAQAHHALALRTAGEHAEAERMFAASLRTLRNGGRHLSAWEPILTAVYDGPPSP